MSVAEAELLREARDDDGEAVVALVAECFAEYPGCLIDPVLELPVFSRPRSHYATEPGGRFWIVELRGQIIGCVGCVAVAGGGGYALQKLYVAPSARRRGIATRLCDRVEREASGRGARFVELWSDTRFTKAHRLYQARGYHRGEQTRALDDASRSVEYYFRKKLRQ